MWAAGVKLPQNPHRQCEREVLLTFNQGSTLSGVTGVSLRGEQLYSCRAAMEQDWKVLLEQAVLEGRL